jgi:hypothetical protein
VDDTGPLLHIVLAAHPPPLIAGAAASEAGQPAFYQQPNAAFSPYTDLQGTQAINLTEDAQAGSKPQLNMSHLEDNQIFGWKKKKRRQKM